MSNEVTPDVRARRSTRVERAVHLASATLPASGAYTNQTAYTVPDGVKSVMFYVTYTRGAASGKAKFKIMAGNGTEEGPIAIADPAVAAAEPLNQQNLRGGEYIGPIPQDASAITFPIPVLLLGGPTTVRLLAGENGVEGTPGTCAITLTASY